MKYLALFTFTILFFINSLNAQDTFKQLDQPGGDIVPEIALEPKDTPPPQPLPAVPSPPIVPSADEALPPPPSPAEIEEARLAIPPAHRPPPAALPEFTPIPSAPGFVPGQSNVITTIRHTIVRDGLTYGTPDKGLVAFSGSGPKKVELVESAKGMIQGLHSSGAHPLTWQASFDKLATEDSSVEALWRISGPPDLVQKTVFSEEYSEASWWWVEGLDDRRVPLEIHLFFNPDGSGEMVCKRGELAVASCRCLTAARSTGKQLSEGIYPILNKCDTKTPEGIPYRMSREFNVPMHFAMNLEVGTGKHLHGGNTNPSQGTTAHGCVRMPKYIERAIYEASEVKKTRVIVHHR